VRWVGGFNTRASEHAPRRHSRSLTSPFPRGPIFYSQSLAWLLHWSDGTICHQYSLATSSIYVGKISLAPLPFSRGCESPDVGARAALKLYREHGHGGKRKESHQKKEAATIIVAFFPYLASLPHCQLPHPTIVLSCPRERPLSRSRTRRAEMSLTFRVFPTLQGTLPCRQPISVVGPTAT
jgi:hypothetical protein